MAYAFEKENMVFNRKSPCLVKEEIHFTK